MGNATDMIASSTNAAEPSASGEAIEMYAATDGAGGSYYTVEIGGLPVVTCELPSHATGVYLFLKAAPEPVISALLSHVITDNPLAV